MTPKLHRQFIATADTVSPGLRQHIQKIGPIKLNSRKHLGLPQFLARIIIGQQVSTKAARTIWSRIKTAAQDSGEGVPGFFCETNMDVLRACGASGNKAKALLAINDAHVDGRITPAKLRRMDTETRCATLLELRGVGQWTVDMASMFYFGDTDVWPNGDLSVARTFEGYLNARQKHKADNYAARFAPHRSYLALYMWEIADALPD